MPWLPVVVDTGIHLHYQVPLWASLWDIEDTNEHTLKIEADLLCELAAVRIHVSIFPDADVRQVSIQRYDFDAAENVGLL